MEQSQNVLNNFTSIDHKHHAVETICRRDHANNVFSIFQGKRNVFESSFTIVLLQISIVLVFSNILRFLLKPLKQARVVSGVLAGIILGPSFLGQSDTFTKYVIPDISKYILENIGTIGLVFSMFLAGVNTDLTVIIKAGKKVWIVTFLVVVINTGIMSLVVINIKDSLEPALTKSTFMMCIPIAMIVTSFQVIYSTLTDMNLISSEIGRLALTIAVQSDFFGLTLFMILAVITQAEKNLKYLWKCLLSIFGMCTVVFIGLPLVVKWISKRTPSGKTVDQDYIIATLLGVFIIGFFTDTIGVAIGTGPIWLGLAIPNGPPMGISIVQKTEVVTNDIIMPFAYASIGLNTNVFAMVASWNTILPLFLLVLMTIFAKLLTSTMLARFLVLSFRDSFILSIMLCVKGQTEYFLFFYWMNLKFIMTPSFSLLVILTTIMTAICCPIIDYMYDPTKSYLINKDRTIEHTMPGSELGILACIYDQESLANLFGLLNLANPTSSNSFTVYTLYLIELLGRGTPMFIDHTKHINVYWDNNNEVIHNAIKNYAEARTNCITIRSFTSVTPNRTMYQDICEISLLYKVKFIILPFHKKSIKGGSDNSSIEIIRQGVKSSNANMLANAPCSVGIFACRNNDNTWETNPSPIFLRIHRQIVMLFLGGQDAREAFSLAARMVEHPNVSLFVIRFLPSDYRGYNNIERKMDDEQVDCFLVQNEWNDQVVYNQVFVNNGLDTVSTIQSLNNSILVDLWIVGRENGVDPILLEGLSYWSENPELGLIGDFLVSMDVNSSGGSVLIVQQQMLRNPQCIPCNSY